MMVCPNCGEKTRVLRAEDYKPDPDKPSYDYRGRRRECTACGERFRTRETHYPPPPNRRI